MGVLDDLLGKTIQINGVSVPDRKLLNFLGSVAVADNVANKSTDVSIAITQLGVDPLTPQPNAGMPTYPTNSQYKISPGITFVRSGATDHDSVRFFGATGAEPQLAAYTFGEVYNLSGFVLDLYPLLTQHLYDGSTDLGAGNPISIQPGVTMFWALDASLNAHVLIAGPGSGSTGLSVVNKVANYNLSSINDAGVMFTDHGASAGITFTLPTGSVPGFECEFSDDTGNGLKVAVQGSDVIRIGTEVTSGGGYLQSNQQGNALRVVQLRSGVYQAAQAIGGWVVA